MVIIFKKYLFSTIIVMGAFFLPKNVASQTKDAGVISQSANFTFIHSAWMGGWQWKSVRDLLEKAGDRVFTPDLPGHDSNKVVISNITMDDYVRRMNEELDKIEGKTILVGHSFGGVVASQLAEVRPEKIDAVVYLCAFMLPNGSSFMDATQNVTTSEVLNNLVFSDDKTLVTIAESMIHNAVAHDVPTQVFAQAKPDLVPEPTAPLEAKLSLSDGKYGSVPKYYVECLNDRAIPVDIQRAMYKEQNVEYVYSLATSHVPMFSNPQGVFDVLIDISGREYVRKATMKASAGWLHAFNSGNAADATAYYERNAKMNAKPFGSFRGHDQIRAFWQGFIDKGAKDLEYFNTDITVLDSSSVRISSQWRANIAKGIITNEHWVLQKDGTMLLSEDHFEIQ